MEAKEIAEEIIRDTDMELHEISASHEDSRTLAQAYLDLLKSQEGMVSVPLEPTEEMIKAGLREDTNYRFAMVKRERVKAVYKAMITKAQEEE